MSLQATVRAPGTCGELVQGTIAGNNFLISCPINLYSEVRVILSPAYQGIKANIEVPKTCIAVKKILEYYGRIELGARIILRSELLVGKGMASSTADITAAVAAVMLALGYAIDTEIIKDIALAVEPTDGIFLPGLHLFDHLAGKVVRYLGDPPLLDILIFSASGQINSIDFNQRRDLSSQNQNKEKSVREALELIKAGIKGNDPVLLGKGASLSSRAHQSILYKKDLDNIMQILDSEKLKGNENVYGVNIAHSGTLLGVLIDKDYLAGGLIKKIGRGLPDLEYIRRVSLIPGGLGKI